jgi:hypothetical protein
LGSGTDWLKANRYWLIACGVLAASGYGAGRFAAPTKKEIVLQTVTEFRDVEKKVVQKGPVKYQKVIVEKPGAERVTTITVQKDPVTITVDRDVIKKETEYVRETVEREAPRLTIGATIGAPIPSLTPSFGGWIQYRFAGPFTAMAQGEGNATGGSARVGLGITF